MVIDLKNNVESYNQDVLKNQGYVYTTNELFSSRVANHRLTIATIALIEKGTKNAIDIGCGDGVYTSELKAAFPEISFTGLDPAVEAIKRAQKNYPNISFLTGNALDASTLPKETFDVAVLRGVLHHTSDPALVISNLKNRAKQLIIIEPNGYNLILKIIEKLSRYHKDHEERSFFPHKIKTWCTVSGYDIRSVEFVGYVPFFCPTFLAKIIFSVQPFLEKVPIIPHLFSAVTVIQCHQKQTQ